MTFQKAFHQLKQPGSFSLIACLLLTLAVSDVHAQTVPQPDEDPVEVSDFAYGAAVDDPANNDPRKAAMVVPAPEGYYSTMLQGTFLAQYMQISTGGRPIPFWGARIMDLDPNSPLHDLGLQSGDVITRLDKITIANNMKRRNRNEPWQIVQMDNHYGPTKVRYIYHATTQVKEETVDLGRHRKGPSGPPRRPVPLAP
ncbi:hypothetical protein [Rubinisphaera italica]|uniref:PDZ domain-containing protein n=1 Tax=Rubinisphaera italica TaxID=2527969 RepID=A0A5C5XMW6_9PLAN|nr:hypothetical protein [Rubinisphaera italica]TWT64536.1 hypothetical protein Pan54_53000 [Rubinisphaera italica]